MAKTKTWKIGEYSKGGVITVTINKSNIKVDLKDWDMSKGTLRSSDQSKAKIYCSLQVNKDETNFLTKIYDFLWEDTTSYYSDMIVDWIKSNLK